MKVRIPQEAKGPNLNSLKQVQKMQDDMAAKQEELAQRIFEASAGGGAVSVKMLGSRKLENIIIDPDAVDVDDMETLQDMICAAVNEVLESVEKTTEEEMNKITGTLSIPGLF